jgi:hypothetical protein
LLERRAEAAAAASKISGSLSSMLRWRPPKPNPMSPRYAVQRVDRARWITMPLVAAIVSVPPAIICAPAIYCPKLQPMFNRVMLAPEQTARANLLLELWFGNGRLPDIVEASILRLARCTRGSRRCLNGWQKT